MTYQSICLSEKLSLFREHWAPKVIAEMNSYQFKLVKIQGEFVWHQHDNTDETFIVLEGEMCIDFEDGCVHIRQGELFVVPQGKQHKPFAKDECQVMVIEPKGVVNTGEEGGNLTAPNDVWI
jgi:mannose-6-phosphate isomerase-like protein (cupin superfamily)